MRACCIAVAVATVLCAMIVRSYYHLYRFFNVPLIWLFMCFVFYFHPLAPLVLFPRRYMHEIDKTTHCTHPRLTDSRLGGTRVAFARRTAGKYCEKLSCSRLT